MNVEDFRLDRLRNRWDVRATLVVDTGLHIGSGEESGNIDAGVVRDHTGRPFIPGSSLKGVLRSEAERVAHVLQLSACGLFPESDICLTTDKQRQAQYKELMRTSGADLSYLATNLCSACQLFGSPYSASRVFFDDLPVDGEDSPPRERRDGVGIDRDTGTAVEHIKYDFEVIPAETAFRLRIQAENLDRASRALLAFVILELQRGTYSIGGKRSRGLGRCRLEGLSVTESKFDTASDMVAYLAAGKPKDAPDPSDFLRACVRDEVSNA